MPRLPFDPKKMAAAEARETPRTARRERAAPSADAERLTVSALTRLIDAALKDRLPRKLRVVGELSGFADRTHWYFSLKDEEAVVACVMFASAARRVSFPPENGMEVVVTGRVEHYARQGKTQIYVESMAPVGAGALDLRYRALCEDLRNRGYFAEERKRALPTFPRRVAVITSRTGAALQDVLNTLAARCKAIEVLIVDTRVQGAQAAPEIAAAVRRVSEQRDSLGIDAIVLTRGGGSLEDLWAFNEPAVADAIYECSIPVIAAIGHETDTTIAELVADVRASTPTQAAMRIAPDAAALHEQMDLYAARLASSLNRRLSQARDRLRAVERAGAFARPGIIIEQTAERLGARRQRLATALDARRQGARLLLERFSTRLARLRPEAVFARRESGLRDLEARLNRAIEGRIAGFQPIQEQRRLDRAIRISLERRGELLASLGRTLTAVGPASVLNRGYSITVDRDGRLVKTPRDVRAGDIIESRLAEGAIHSRVTPDEAPIAPAPRQAKRGRSKPQPKDEPPGLFETD